MATLLDVKNLSIWFRSAGQERLVVADSSFSIDEGEVLGLVGESGSGKSVTALAVLRLLDPAARIQGLIRFGGIDLLTLQDSELRKRRGREIAMIFQEPMTALNPVMTIGEQVAEAIRAHQPGLSRRQVRRVAIEALESVAIPDAANRYVDYPHQFSGGQRQRILIAMAIANRPRLLIADEPTTALDVTVQAQILELLAELRSQFGLAMLFISHDLAVVSQVADRVMVMRNGMALESGSTAQVFHDPLHPYTASLIGAIPTLTTDRDLPLATLTQQAEADGGRMVERFPGHWVRQSQIPAS
ncbi:Dipeptide transport ATP-binding protein DppD [Acidisarcina polymorpha]|uniref:Dipeptide transport ATP-binding protein DppD n=1 Tax=Acidisarcina polymorpha TaxID=2211140 RepID=A0A2Z5FVX4_9BACT|nr:ABC transporter ATP-binding protein [Acidisarcina polymorpha]AXC11018.1 Dipeptide transport ATP-binding protein DppD [Acidisarcina polymorpha]